MKKLDWNVLKPKAIRLLESGKYSREEVIQELGIGSSSFYRWVEEDKVDLGSYKLPERSGPNKGKPAHNKTDWISLLPKLKDLLKNSALCMKDLSLRLGISEDIIRNKIKEEELSYSYKSSPIWGREDKN